MAEDETSDDSPEDRSDNYPVQSFNRFIALMVSDEVAASSSTLTNREMVTLERVYFLAYLTGYVARIEATSLDQFIIEEQLRKYSSIFAADY